MGLRPETGGQREEQSEPRGRLLLLLQGTERRQSAGAGRMRGCGPHLSCGLPGPVGAFSILCPRLLGLSLRTVDGVLIAAGQTFSCASLE